MSTKKPRQKAAKQVAKPPVKPLAGRPTHSRDSESPGESNSRILMARATVPPELQEKRRRVGMGLPESEEEPGDYMVELNLLYGGGLQVASEDFLKLYEKALGAEAAKRPAVLVSKTYYRCRMSVAEWRRLVQLDEAGSSEKPGAGQPPQAKRSRVIYRIWPDFKVKALIDRSTVTVKADAAARSFAATGTKIVWAVIDSGIQAEHVHFGGPRNSETARKHTLYHPSVAELHRDFTGGALPTGKKQLAENIKQALTDEFGHGTHVAGIIAGGLAKEKEQGKDFEVYERVYQSDGGGEPQFQPRRIDNPEQLHGVAPECRLISLKALDANGIGRASDVMSALQYIREELNGDPKLLRVHGVNLSVGYEFDAEMFACGQSPLCVEVNRLVKSGVVVVVAAGNTGYGGVDSKQRLTQVGLSNTINDPGNADLAITVGATHRDAPHMYGVSYFSSKGPTGDGRLKPDLVAPGERITSCAAARSRMQVVASDLPAYVDDTGTSMAAPHVSGAIAAFLSIRREFIQRPEEVKRIFTESATSLGRERYFEGNGLIDLMRAIQSV